MTAEEKRLAHIRALVDEAPPFNDEQKALIRHVFAGRITTVRKERGAA